MAIEQPTRLVSNLAIHPGEFLEEEVEFGMTRPECAERTGIPVGIISEIIRGERGITDDLAVELESALGSPAHMWMNSQARYDVARARSGEDVLG